MRRGANQLSLGGFNQRVVLDLIRRQRSGVSRVEIAQQTGLSTQTITNVTRRLLEAGLVEEAGLQVRGPGKPRTLLVPRGDGLYAVGLHIDPAMTHGILMDLDGGQRATFTMAAAQELAPARATQELAEFVRRMVREAAIPEPRVAGVGIAVPGPLRDGVLVDPPLMPTWRGFDLRASLASQLGWPVLIEKDVIASVRGEMWLRENPANDSFAFLYFGSGVGSGAVIHGEVQRGASGNFGEIGHLQVGEDGPPCPCCGRVGTLGLALRPQSIVAAAAAASGQAPAPGTHGVDARFRAVCQAAVSDPRLEPVLQKIGRDIGMAAALVSDLWDVQEVVIGGPYWPVVEAAVSDTVRETVEDRAVLASARPVGIRTASSPERAECVGAAAMVLGALLSPSPAALMTSTRADAAGSPLGAS